MRAPPSLWVVRHARTDWTGARWCGRSDPDLNDIGRAEAGQLATELRAGLGPRAASAIVLTSPLRRALQTAEIIAAAVGSRIELESALTEVDFGAADGLTWDALVTAHPAIADRVVAQQEVDWPGGETAHEVAARAQVAADRVLAAIAQDRAVVAVSHGGILGAVLPLITTMPAPPHLDPGSALAIDPASM